MTTHYARLGLTPSATAEEIRAAWRQAAFDTHPDQGGSLDEFMAARAAFDVLTDPAARAAYDRELLAAGSVDPAPAPPPGTPDAPPEPAAPSTPLRRLRVSGAAMGSLTVLLTEIGRLETTRRHHLAHGPATELDAVEHRLEEAYRRLTPLAHAMGLQPATLLADPALAAELAARPVRPAPRRTPAAAEPADPGAAPGSEDPTDPVEPEPRVVHPSLVAPDGTVIELAARSVHGVAIPTPADARRYHLGRPRTLATLRPDDPLYRLPTPMVGRAPRRLLAALWHGPRTRTRDWDATDRLVAQAAFLIGALAAAKLLIPTSRAEALGVFYLAAVWAMSWPVRLTVRAAQRRHRLLGHLAATVVPLLGLAIGLTVAALAGQGLSGPLG